MKYIFSILVTLIQKIVDTNVNNKAISVLLLNKIRKKMWHLTSSNHALVLIDELDDVKGHLAIAQDLQLNIASVLTSQLLEIPCGKCQL